MNRNERMCREGTWDGGEEAWWIRFDDGQNIRTAKDRTNVACSHKRNDEVRRSWSDDRSCVAREAMLAARNLLQEKVRQRKAESVPTVLQWHRAQQFQNHRRAREDGDHAQSFLFTVASLSGPNGFITLHTTVMP